MRMNGEESREVARAALRIAVSRDRQEETVVEAALKEEEILAGAADCGGDFVASIPKMVERAISCARREGLVGEGDHETGAVAGAAHEAINQVSGKALGLSVGGKIGVARSGDHVAVAVFLCVGLGHLDEMCVGMGHRVI